MNTTLTAGITTSMTIALTVALSACGGGGGSSTPRSTLSTSSLQTCVVIPGALDGLQSGLNANLLPALSTLPVAGESASKLAASLVEQLEILDGLSRGFNNLATNPSPAAFASDFNVVRDSLSCLAGNLTRTLVELQNTLAPGLNLPGVSAALNSISTLQNLLTLKPGDTTSAPPSLASLTSALRGVQTALAALPARLPANNQVPAVNALLGLLALGSGQIANALDGGANLNPAAVQSAFTGLLSALQTALTPNNGLNLGIPTTALQQLVQPLQQGLGSLNSAQGPTAVLAPLFTALSTVLTPLLPAGSNPADAFTRALGGVLNGLPSNNAQLAPFLQALQGGGLSPTGTPIPTLGSVITQLLGLLNLRGT